MATAAEAPEVSPRLLKEPRYKQAPRYFLLVFGPEAKTRIWCVFDGDKVLYVDRNGTGDLTEAGNRLLLHEKEPSFLVGDISERDGKATHRNLRISLLGPRAPGQPTSASIQVEIKGEYVETTTIEMSQATARAEDAPSRHFYGPLSICLHDEKHVRFVRGKGQQLLAISLGMYSPESKEWVFVSHDKGVPTNISPLAEIAFPGKTADARAIVVKMPVFGRC
jgi:hypothetical protein